MLALKFELGVFLVAWLVWVVLFTKQPFSRRLWCTFLVFFLSSFSVQSFNFPCTPLLQLISFIAYFKIKLLSIYNSSRRLNVCCMKSKNIRLRFIASSSRTSISHLSRLKAILYCSNNTLLFVISMHGLPISNRYFCLDEGHIHFSYSTLAFQYGSLIFVKYKNLFYTFSRSNENSLLVITVHKTLSRCFSINI